MLSFSCPPHLTCRILSLAEFPVWPSRWQGQGWNMSAVKRTRVTRKSLCNLIHSDAKCSNSSFLPYTLCLFFIRFWSSVQCSTLFWSLSVHLVVFARAAVCLREILLHRLTLLKEIEMLLTTAGFLSVATGKYCCFFTFLLLFFPLKFRAPRRLEWSPSCSRWT